jgi:type IV fimbrial biogenesis protein FimT
MNYNINMIKTRGFTLIELMITLAVVGIVLLTGLPSLNKMTDSNRLVSQINSLSGSLALARSEAIKSGKVVTICASSNTTSCNVTTWHSGWIVFTDLDKDTVVDAGIDTRIQIQGALNGGPTLKLTLSDNTGTYQFLPDGSSRDSNSSGSTIGTFILCPKDNDVDKAKALNVNFIGRSSPAQRATPTSPIFDAAGSAVTCP